MNLIRKILPFLLATCCFLFPIKLSAQAVPVAGPPNFVVTQYLYKHITTDATTVVKSVPGVLHTVCVSTPAATETVTIYDAKTAVAPIIAVLTSYASLPGCFTFDVVFNVGLTIVTATAAGDITVAYQ